MPIWFRVAIGASLIWAGFWMGYSFANARFVEYRAKVELEGAIAEANLHEVVRKHDQTTKQISHNYQTELVELHGYYSRMLDDQPSGSRVPPVSRAPQSANGTPSCKPVRVVSQECAETALKLRELQNWARQISK